MDVPLNETTESYLVSILNNLNQIVRTIPATTNLCNYSNSQQITDFGSSQNVVKARIYQLSEAVGKGEEIEKTFNF